MNAKPKLLPWLTDALRARKGDATASTQDPRELTPWAILPRAVRTLRHRWGAWLIVLTCIPSLTLAWTLLQVLVSRVGFPMDLEWCEGGQMLHAYRLLHGMELFTEPGQGFLPYSYPPGHTLVLALAGAVFGLDYWVGRMVSVVAMAGVMALLAREVFREFRPLGFPAVWAILAVGSMVAAFPVSGGWFDLIRNDGIVLLLVFAAAVVSFDAGPMSRVRFFGSVALMNAAVFTKQTAVFYVTWIMLFQLARNPRRGLLLGTTLALFGGATTAFLEWTTSGRYLYYTVSLLSNQVVHKNMYQEAIRIWLEFAPYLPVLPIALMLVLWFNLGTIRALFWSGMLLAAVPASMLPYAKQGGYLNNLLPVALLAGPVALCLTAALLRHAPRRTRFESALTLLVATTAAFYLQARQFPAKKYSMPPERWAAVSRLNHTLRGLGDSFLMPHHPFLAIRAGSSIEQIHEMPWVDAWLAGVQNLNLRPFVERTKPQYVVLTGMEVPVLKESIARDYVPYQTLPQDQLVPPITGFPSYPREILVRRERQ